MNHEFMEALDELEKDRGIDKEILIDTIEQALLTAYKKELRFSSKCQSMQLTEKEEMLEYYSQRRVVDESDLYDTFLRN